MPSYYTPYDASTTTQYTGTITYTTSADIGIGQYCYTGEEYTLKDSSKKQNHEKEKLSGFPKGFVEHWRTG